MRGIRAMPAIPQCEFREKTPTPSLYYCRHIKVRTDGHIVTNDICANCSVHNQPCPNPRPLNYIESKTPPPLARQAWNAAKSIKNFVADGMKTVSTEDYAARLSICDECEDRRGDRCLQCGCRLSWKARGRAFDCPLGKWPHSKPKPQES